MAQITPPTSPKAATSSGEGVLSEIQNIFAAVSALSNLEPGKHLDGLFTRLVELCITPYHSDFVNSFFGTTGVTELCERLRSLCAVAEGELELYWAKSMLRQTNLDSSAPKKILQTFPYYQNYIDLSRIECSTIEAFLPSQPSMIAFIGSGPLPLTSLCIINRNPDIVVHNIDRDIAALKLSVELSKVLGYGKNMTFACEDVSRETPTGTDWPSMQVVFVAALVGMDNASKFAILASLSQKLRAGTLVVIRSAHGLRGVLYPVFDLSCGLDQIGLELLVEVHPWTKVVNSIILLRVKDREWCRL